MIPIASLSQDLSQPEYIHVLLNPLPVYGLAMGILALVISLFLRSRPAQVTALVLICLSGVAAWPVVEYGEKGYDRVKSLVYTDGQKWLDAHMERADETVWVFYVLAAIAFAAIVAPVKWPKSAAPLTGITLLLAVAALGVGSWIAYAGGRVRHSEFRNAPPPETDEHEHEHESHE